MPSTASDTYGRSRTAEPPPQTVNGVSPDSARPISAGTTSAVSGAKSSCGPKVFIGQMIAVFFSPYSSSCASTYFSAMRLAHAAYSFAGWGVARPGELLAIDLHVWINGDRAGVEDSPSIGVPRRRQRGQADHQVLAQHGRRLAALDSERAATAGEVEEAVHVLRRPAREALVGKVADQVLDPVEREIRRWRRRSERGGRGGA